MLLNMIFNNDSEVSISTVLERFGKLVDKFDALFTLFSCLLLN